MRLLDRLARGLKQDGADDNSGAGAAPAPVERRRETRHGLGAPTVVMLPGVQAGVRAFIRDISKGGCLLDTEAEVQVGNKLALAFLSKVGGHCHAVGRVVRVADKQSFGVQFSQVNMAFLGFVGSVSSASPEGRVALVAAMKGSTIEIDAGP